MPALDLGAADGRGLDAHQQTRGSRSQMATRLNVQRLIMGGDHCGSADGHGPSRFDGCPGFPDSAAQC